MKSPANKPQSKPPKNPIPDGPRFMPQQSISMYRWIVSVFLALTVAVIVLVAYVVLSRADVVVLAKQEQVKADFIVDVASKPSGDDVPGTILQMQDEVTQTFPSTSVVKIDAPAEGQVKITSTFPISQTLIATTRLLTPDGTLYRIKKNVTIPANGSATVDVFADQPGAKGDVDSATFTIPGLKPSMQKYFTAATVGPLSGGVKDEHMVTQQDVDAAASVLHDKLQSSLTDQLRQKGKTDVATATGEILNFQVTKNTLDAQIGDERDSFSMTVGLNATGLFYDKSKFDADIRNQLIQDLPQDRALTSIDEKSQTVDVEKIDLVGGRASVHVVAVGTDGISKDSPALSKDKLVGISADAAVKYLEHLDGVASASVALHPFWIGRLPNVPDHISVEVR